MSFYKYKGRDKAGLLIQNTIQADSEEQIYHELLNQDILPTEIHEIKTDTINRSIVAQLKELFNFNKISLDQLSMFARQMYILSKAGVPITLAFQQLADNTWNPRLKTVLQSITEKLRSGINLENSMQEFPDVFSPLMLGMIRIGESTGRLDQAFFHLNKYLEVESNTLKRFKTALRYPLFVFLTVLMAIFTVTVFVIPKFASAYEKAHIELPKLTIILITISNFLIHNWWLALIIFLAITWGVYTYMRTPKGRYAWHTFLLKAPIFGKIYKLIIMVRFTQQFSIAFNSGISLIEILHLISHAIANEYVRIKIKTMSEAIEQGHSISQAAASIHFFSPLELQIFAVGEQTGDLGNVFTHISEFYERELEYNLVHLSDLLQPLLIIILSILILFVGLAIYLPIWNMVNLIHH